MAKPDNRGGKRGPRPIRIHRYRFDTVYEGTDEQVLQTGIVFANEMPGHPDVPRRTYHKLERDGRPIRISRTSPRHVHVTVGPTADEQAILDEEERQEKADKAAERAERAAESYDSMQELFDKLARLKPDQIRRIWSTAKRVTAAKCDDEFQRFLSGVIRPHAQK